jgi:hypothetical protein
MRFQPDKYSQEMENDALKFTWKEKNMEFNENPNYYLIIDNFKRSIEDISSKTAKNI